VKCTILIEISLKLSAGMSQAGPGPSVEHSGSTVNTPSEDAFFVGDYKDRNESDNDGNMRSDPQLSLGDSSSRIDFWLLDMLSASKLQQAQHWSWAYSEDSPENLYDDTWWPKVVENWSSGLNATMPVHTDHSSGPGSDASLSSKPEWIELPRSSAPNHASASSNTNPYVPEASSVGIERLVFAQDVIFDLDSSLSWSGDPDAEYVWEELPATISDRTSNPQGMRAHQIEERVGIARALASF
jgi:hypothetical protein